MPPPVSRASPSLTRYLGGAGIETHLGEGERSDSERVFYLGQEVLNGIGAWRLHPQSGRLALRRGDVVGAPEGIHDVRPSRPRSHSRASSSRYVSWQVTQFAVTAASRLRTASLAAPALMASASLPNRL